MKQLPNVISKLFYEPAVVTPQRHAAICQTVEARLAASMSAPVEPAHGEQAESRAEQRRRLRMEDMMEVVGGTAIIRVNGVLVAYPEDIGMSECGCAMDDLNRCIDTAEHAPSVETILYHFNTPGGVITRIPETGNKIRASRKQTIGFTDSECCSGGLWLASQCQRFYASQSSRVGSVGVYTLCMDLTQAMKREGIKINAVFAGKYKLLGAYWEPLTDEKRELIQARVDKIYEQFKEAMEAFRVVDDRNFGNGLVFDGEEAAKMGFTDGVMDSLDDILDGPAG